MNCPTCAKEVPAESLFCPLCGSALDAGDIPTVTRVGSAHHPSPVGNPPIKISPSSKSSPQPSASGFGSRYVPGATIADRYRIVSPLGKGGMGEVYRADDLKLGQTVALKFLPPSLAQNEDARARYHREVRLARQVSHPNVCRVFDIGETNGQTFLTMEFVDGEDLASLIRRIGRLPPDKALEMGRQICAGLAAAHEHGIIHLDLKPANIMLDGRGRVRITDFGLAAVTAEMQDGDARAGTPAYMSPEQFSGGEVTSKSDLYALGLVLYEIFTGKKPFEAASFEEMARAREKSAPTLPSHYLKDIDPLVERVIVRCLEKTPAKRPASALQVAAALPGGDPLAAALAAGETPSPEMVAAAGTEGRLAPWKAVTLLAAILILLLCAVFLAQRAVLLNLVPGEKSPEVLTEKARSIVAALGYTTPPLDNSFWFAVDDSYLSYLSKIPAPARYRQVANDFPSPVSFLYRQSPQSWQTSFPWQITAENPPATTPGDLTVGLDTQGRLTSLRVIPLRELNASTPPALVDWTILLREAGLDPTQSRTIAADWYPEVPMDQQFAWEVTYDGKLARVHAGAYRGRAVFFSVQGAWAESTELPMAENRAAVTLGPRVVLIVIIGVLMVCFFVARRNVRLGRSDTKGARRAVLVLLFALVIGHSLRTHWSSEPVWELSWLEITICAAAGTGLLVCMFYIALEPYVRQTWPGYLISWHRVLAGQFRNALVGRDVLLGVVFGLLLAVTNLAAGTVPHWFNVSGVTPDTSGIAELRDTATFAGFLVQEIATAAIYAVSWLAMLFLFRKLTRSNLAAFALLMLIWTISFLDPHNPWGELPFSILLGVLLLLCLIHAGLLSLLVAWFTAHTLSVVPLTSDFSRWYAYRSVATILLVLALALYGFWISLGGEQLLGTAFED